MQCNVDILPDTAHWALGWSQFCYLPPLPPSLPPSDKSGVTQSQVTADHDLAPRLLDTPADDPDCVPGQICSTLSMSVLITASTLAALGGSRAGRTRGSVRIFPCRSITTVLARRTQQRPPPAAPRAAASPPPTPTSSSSSSSPSSTSSSSRASPSAAVIRNVLYTKISTSVV